MTDPKHRKAEDMSAKGLRDGRVVRASAVVLATGPRDASKLVGESTRPYGGSWTG